MLSFLELELQRFNDGCPVPFLLPQFSDSYAITSQRFDTHCKEQANASPAPDHSFKALQHCSLLVQKCSWPLNRRCEHQTALELDPSWVASQLPDITVCAQSSRGPKLPASPIQMSLHPIAFQVSAWIPAWKNHVVPSCIQKKSCQTDLNPRKERCSAQFRNPASSLPDGEVESKSLGARLSRGATVLAASFGAL